MASGLDGRVVVVGGCGELGWEVVKAASASPMFGQVVASYYHTKPLPEQSNCPRVHWVHVDCGDHAAVRNVLAAAMAVVYCAVPKHGGANGKGGDNVRRGIVDDVVFAARVCAETGTRFIAISTDLVFDGTRAPGERYTERDDVCPTNVYGKYKADMEKSLAGMSNVVVARTSLVLTLGDGSATRPHGKGIKFIVDALTGMLPGQSGAAFTLFTDELRCMSFSDDLAAALVELAGPDCDHEGLIHVVADEVSNRFELARRVAAHLGLSAKFDLNVVAGLSAESGMNRPLNCALSTELLVSVLKTVRVRGISERLPCHAQDLPATTL